MQQDGRDSTGIGRAYLPCPHPLPFVLIGHKLICPWERRPRGELRPEQARQLADVRRTVAEATRPLPEMAWVSAAGGVIPMRDNPGGSWIARRVHDGQVVMMVAV
jgi:hypothetical protein